MPKPIMTKQKFINQWIRHFAKNVSSKDIDSYVKNQYIWHIFSWDLLCRDTFLVGDEARQAYDKEDKSNCIFCETFGSGVSEAMKEDYISSKSIDMNVTELYVVSKDYSWTYIKTHEGDLCGPYFMKLT